MLKTLTKSLLFQNIASKMLAGYLALVWHTSRWTIEGQEAVTEALQRNRPLIVVFWHSRMTMAPFAWLKGYPFHMLISQHKDGILIAKTVGHLGIDTIAGSSSHGGREALQSMISLLKQGQCVGITPDGPRGPKEEVKPGVYMLSLFSGCPVIALSFSMSRQCLLRSWDRLRIPLPFGKGALVYQTSACPLAEKGNRDQFLASLKIALEGADKKALDLAGTSCA